MLTLRISDEVLDPEAKVIEQRGRSRSNLWLSIANGTFPPPVKVGQRKNAWPRSETQAILRLVIRGAPDDEIRELVKQLVAKRTAPVEEAA